MTTLATFHGDLGHLLAVGGGEVDKVSAYGGEWPANAMGFLCDQMGSKYFKYVQSRTTVMTQGALLSRVGDKNGMTSVANVTAASSLVLAVTTGLTADAHNGATVWVLDNADAAGAAPEAEIAFVLRNSTTRILLDPKYPLTTALALNDDLQLLATMGVEAAAADDLNGTVMGVVVSPDGLPAANWGWIQSMGPCRAQMTASAGLLIGQQIMAGAALINAADSGAKFQETIGYAKAALTSDVVSDMALVYISCGEHAMGGTSDQDAVA